MKKKDLAIEFAVWLMINGWNSYEEGDMGHPIFANKQGKGMSAEHLYCMFLTEREELK